MLFIVIEPYEVSRFWVFWNGLYNELSSRIYSIMQTCPCVYVLSPAKSLAIFKQRSIVDMGMKKVHLCFDKQLYDVTIQEFWNQPRKFQNIVVHPACMYIIVIFCLHWNLNKMLSLGILCHCILWSNMGKYG